MAGSIEFTPPYQDGWQDNEEGATPITADILNNNYDAFLLALNGWIESIESTLVTIDGKIPDELDDFSDVILTNPSNGQVLKYDSSQGKWVNANESGGGGGSNVSWEQTLQSGTKIGAITINGTPYNVYAPTPPTKTSDLTNDSNFVADASYVHTDNNYTTTEKNKLADLNQVEANPSSGTSAGNLNSIKIGGTKYDITSGGSSGGFEPNGDSYRIISSKDGSDTVLSLEYYEDGSQSSVEMKMCSAGSSFTQDFHNLHLVSNGATVSVSSKIDSIRFNDNIFNENDEIFSVTIGSASATYSDIEEGTYTPGGGSTVSWTQTQQSGTKIAEISIDGVSQNVYIPTPPANTSDLNNDSNFVADASYVHTDNNYTSTEKTKLSGLVAVEANPSGTASTDLTKIAINGTNYNIPSGGGGGTTVIANPSGTPTDELNSIQIGNDIYEISSGGGSASWKDITGILTAGQTSITLSSLYILTTSTLDFYTDKFGVSPTNAVVTNGSVTLTFEAQSTDLAVKVRITNDEIPAIPLIPKMTSNTLPNGVASASTEYNTNYYAYKAFDDNSSTLWGSHDSHSVGEWIKYDFGLGNEKKLDSFYFLNRSETNYAVGSFKFQGSNDDVNWTDLAEVTGLDVNDSATVSLNSTYKNTAFRYVRWLIVSNAHGGSGTGFVELQVNGWEA